MLSRPYKIKLIDTILPNGEVKYAKQTNNLLFNILPLVNKAYSQGASTCMGYDDYINLNGVNSCPPGIRGIGISEQQYL